jgi:hypothetical protein
VSIWFDCFGLQLLGGFIYGRTWFYQNLRKQYDLGRAIKKIKDDCILLANNCLQLPFVFLMFSFAFSFFPSGHSFFFPARSCSSTWPYKSPSPGPKILLPFLNQLGFKVLMLPLISNSPTTSGVYVNRFTYTLLY